MKKNWKMACLGLILIWLVQSACYVGQVFPKQICELNGGIWHEEIPKDDSWCEMPKKPAPNAPSTQPEVESNPPQPNQPVSPLATATGEYLTPTPASAQECNATLYVQVLVEVITTKQEQYYRECEYKLSLTNIHPSEGIWVVRKTNVSVHSSATDLDDSYWYSDLIFPGQLWEKLFRSNYYTNGQFSREGVDRVAGVFNRLDCLYLLTSAEVEAISQPVEWACGP